MVEKKNKSAKKGPGRASGSPDAAGSARAVAAAARRAARDAERAQRSVVATGSAAYALAGAALGSGAPLEGLAQVAVARAGLDAATRLLVVEAVAGGASWADVGTALGMTRQSAHERYRAVVQGGSS